MALLVALALVSASACADGPVSPSVTTGGNLESDAGGTGAPGTAGGNGGGGTNPSADTPTAGVGRLVVDITDTPFSDALAVLVTFVEVSVHRTGGGWETIPFADEATSRTCDLKKLEGPTDILGVGILPADKYTQLRLTVESGSIHFENESESVDPCAPEIPEPEGLRGTVEVPSGVIKLNRPFTLAADGETTILLDFDGDKSISQKGGPKNGNPDSPGCNGRGKKPGCDEDPNGEEDEDAGVFMMKPVIGVVSVNEEAGGGA
jgi:hypothetical protein